MAELVYAGITSLDGYVADAQGDFGWAAPGPDVHRFVNDLEHRIGTHLYGRRLYEVMSVWDAPEEMPGLSGVERDYAAVWGAADKIVFSRTLTRVSTARTRLERDLDLASVRDLVRSSTHDVSIGGPGLAADVIRAGLVDQVHQFLHPVVVGGGTPFLPADAHLELELHDVRRFDAGVVYLRYGATRSASSASAKASSSESRPPSG